MIIKPPKGWKKPVTRRDIKLKAIKAIGPRPPYSGFPISPYCDECNHKTANHGPQRCAVGTCQCRNLCT